MKSLHKTETLEVQPEPSAEVEQLYQQHYPTLLSAALDHPGRLMAQDAERIVGALAGCLNAFSGEPTDESFTEWAMEAIQSAADRMVTFYQWMRDYRKFVFAAIWAILKKNRDLVSSKEIASAAREIAQNAWAWIFEHLDELVVPGRATIKTRLYSIGKFAALTWRKERLRHRTRFMDADVENAGYEIEEDGGGGTLIRHFEPDQQSDEYDDDPIRPNRQTITIDQEPGGQSGTPRLLCQICDVLQAVLNTTVDSATLRCGHIRRLAAAA
jgi:hypothetical protein